MKEIVTDSFLECEEAKKLIEQMHIPEGQTLKPNGDITVYDCGSKYIIELDRGQDPHPPYKAEYPDKISCIKGLLKILISNFLLNENYKRRCDLEIQFLKPLVSKQELYDAIKRCSSSLNEINGGAWFYNGTEFLRY